MSQDGSWVRGRKGYQGRQPEDDRYWPDEDYDQPAGHGSYGGYDGQDGDRYSRDRGGSAGYGDQAGYDSSSNGTSYGGSYNQDSYRPYDHDPYGRESSGQGTHSQGGYAAGDPFGQTGRSGEHPFDAGQGWDRIGRHAGRESGADTDATSAYRPAADRGSYDPLDTGSYPATDSGYYDPLDTGSYPRQSGGDRYGRGDHAPGRPYAPVESGGYDWPDSGSFDHGDPASRREHDAVRYDRPDADPFDEDTNRGRSGDFGQRGSGSYEMGSGSFERYPPPSAASRGPGGRDEISQTGRGPLPADRDGYASWHDDPDEEPLWEAQDEDIWDEDDRMPRRLGRGGGRGGGDGRRRARGSAAGGRKNRPKPPRRGRGRAASLAALLIVLGVIGGVAFVGYRAVHSWIIHRYGDYTGSGTGTVKITVPQGASLVGLGPTLLQDNVIMALRPYDSAAGRATNASSLQPGTYLLHHHMNAARAVQLLLSGKTRINNIFTVLPDARALDIAAKLAAHTGLPVSQFTQLIEHPPATLGLPSWASGHTAEGFLFPDTYRLAPNQTALQILQGMVKDFTNRTASLSLPSAAAKVYTTPFHIIVVASMIQAEGNATDFAKVSRVIWNRLKDNMPLEFDSTVFYAMHKYGTSITQAEEKFPSPYNTYLHTGLPPGPIGSPSLAAIQAALHPAAGGWLYFITDVKSANHTTYFTSSLSQFQKWQQQFGS